jgi:hypothetical protein
VRPTGWPKSVFGEAAAAGITRRSPSPGPVGDLALLEQHRRLAVSRDEQGAVEIVDVAELAEQPGGRHRQTGADHVADHDAEAEPSRLGSHRETFGQTAALVELDVDDIAATDHRFDVDESLHALVRRDRDRTAQAFEIRFAPAGKGLFHQSDPAGDQRRHQRLEAVGVESLVGVDPEPGVGPRLAHRAHALPVERGVARQFQLERTRLRVFDGLGGHGPGIVGGNRESRGQRLRWFESGETPGRLARALGLEIPECAIERIARTARRQESAQCLAVDARHDVAPHAFDRGAHVVRVVIEVVDAGRLALSARAAVAQLSDDDLHLGEGVARDREWRRKRELFSRNLEMHQ